MMDKRACSKFADPELNFRNGDGLFLLGKLSHIVRSSVKNIAGHRTLVLYFYNREAATMGSDKPEYTLFQCKDDYVTLRQTESGKIKWISGQLDNMGERYGYFTNACAFYRQRDEQIVTRYCGIEDRTGFDALSGLQNSIMASRQKERALARERETIKRMKPVPAAPRGLKGWINRDVLPHYIFYDRARSGRPRSGYCTACRSDVTVSGAKHNIGGTCPSCGKSVMLKAGGISKNVLDRDTVQVLQKAGGNELILKVFKVSCSLRNWREPMITIWESARIFIKPSDDKKLTYEPFYYSASRGTLTHWIRGERPKFSCYQYNFEGDVCGFLYCDGVEAALADTPWQYCQLERFQQIDRDRLNLLPYLRKYDECPAIEYLVKLGLTNLTAHVVYAHNGASAINANGKNLREVLGVEPEDLPMLQAINASARQLELYGELKRNGIKIDEALLVWYGGQDIHSTDDILVPLRFTTPHKLMRYIESQRELYQKENVAYSPRFSGKLGKALSDYRDYLEMGKNMEYDFSESFVLFPRNLKSSHDHASTLFDAKKAELFDKAIRGTYTVLAEQYLFSEGGFTIMPPRASKEIVDEGHTLRHCVHSYVERVANGECIILFIRRIGSIHEPFYTLELRNGIVKQIHGTGHSEPTAEVNKFLESWKRKKLAAPSTRNSAA